jgi:KaiC/GvpD/RAD55 family RecA-like ATPase
MPDKDENPKTSEDESMEEEFVCQICGGPINSSTKECEWCGIKASKTEKGEEPKGEDKAIEAVLSSEEALARWLAGDTKSVSKMISEEIKQQDTETTSESDDALKRWLMGEESEIEKWLGEAPVGEAIEAPTPPPEIGERERILQERETALKKQEEEIEKSKIYADELKKQLEQHLDKIKSGEFEPLKIIEENSNLRKELEYERRKRESMEKEIEHIKRGSIAVIKYVKAQQARMRMPKEGVSDEISKKLKEETELRKKLESEIANLKEQLETKIKHLPLNAAEIARREYELSEKERALQDFEAQLKLREKTITEKTLVSGDEAGMVRKLEEEMREKENTLLNLQKSIMLRDEEIQQLKADLRIKSDELEKLKAPLAYKEREMAQREADLRFREEKLARELKRLTEAQKQVKGLDIAEAKRKVESLEREIAMKEVELRTREKYLRQKERELEIKAKKLVGQEIEVLAEERMLELKEEKVKTGVPRMDDLLFGGFPLATNVLVYGPPFVGKEVLLNCFIAEGLKKGVPGIWVLTNKSTATIREEMQYILPHYLEYERTGLVRYIDIYSRSVGEVTTEPGVIYIEQATDIDAIIDAVDTVVEEFKKKKYEYYRLAFDSISTLMVRLDPSSTFKFLQPFCGKRKRDKAVALYTLEQGMHSSTDISTLGHIMDGEIDFKSEQLKTLFQVKGICEVQSREWIQYTFTKRGLNIGSFSLQYVR